MDENERYETMDLPFYKNEIAPILPPVVLDFHTHIWSSANWKIKPWESENEHGKYVVSQDRYEVETLIEDGRRCFPDRKFEAVVFGYPIPVTDRAKDTEFVKNGRHRRLSSATHSPKNYYDRYDCAERA